MHREQKTIFGYFLFLVIGALLVFRVLAGVNQQGLPVVVMGPGPVILVSPAESNNLNCGNISVDDCLKKIQTFLRLTALPFTSQESELDVLCNNAIAGYNCSVHRYTTDHCLSTEDKALFPIFTIMAQYPFLMFCDSASDRKPYRKEDLLKNSDCILKQKNALDCCAEQSKVPDLPIMYILDQSRKSLTERQIAACCPVANYIKCVGEIINKNCGEAANNLTIEYIRRASGEQTEAVCQTMRDYPVADPEVCKTPAPVCVGCRLKNIGELVILTSLLLIIQMRYIGSI